MKKVREIIEEHPGADAKKPNPGTALKLESIRDTLRAKEKPGGERTTNASILHFSG